MNSNKMFLAVSGLLAALAVIFRVAPAVALFVAFGLVAVAYLYYPRFLRP